METYIIRASNGNQGAVTNRLQNEVASGKSVQETSLSASSQRDPVEIQIGNLEDSRGAPKTCQWVDENALKFYCHILNTIKPEYMQLNTAPSLRCIYVKP
jgi:hypothetical protein